MKFIAIAAGVLALSACGQLSQRIGGPSVRPPQPTEYASVTYANSAKWVESTGADRYRRGLYTFFQRTSPYPMLMTFDSPDSNECAARRQTSNTPLQALVTLNDPVYIEAAQALARRIVAAGESAPHERVEFAFQTCLTRPPQDTEVRRLVELYEQSLAEYQADPQAATQMATDPLGPAPAAANVAELAAWTVVANVLLNLDEMFMKR